MEKEKIILDFKGSVLDKITQNMELAGYNDRDVMAIRGVACYEGVNKNNSLFERADLYKAEQTLSSKPIKIRFVDNNPTGHGLNLKTGAFDKLVQRVGFINYVWGNLNTDNLEDDEVRENWDKDFAERKGTYEIMFEGVVWQKDFPNISKRIRELHNEGNLNFSIEAEVDYLITAEGYKKCFNIHFTGIAIVDNPAFPEAKSLMVAEILNKGDKVEMDELKKLLESVNSTIGTEIAEQFKKHLGVLNENIEALKNENAGLKVEVAEKKGELSNICAELESVKSVVNEYKTKEEFAQKQIIGTERYEKLKKYGEVASTIDEIAELSNEKFADLLCEMVDKYVPSDKKIAVPFVKAKDETSSKEKLIKFLI